MPHTQGNMQWTSQNHVHHVTLNPVLLKLFWLHTLHINLSLAIHISMGCIQEFTLQTLRSTTLTQDRLACKKANVISALTFLWCMFNIDGIDITSTQYFKCTTHCYPSLILYCQLLVAHLDN